MNTKGKKRMRFTGSVILVVTVLIAGVIVNAFGAECYPDKQAVWKDYPKSHPMWTSFVEGYRGVKCWLPGEHLSWSPVAQRPELVAHNRLVGGSSPPGRTILLSAVPLPRPGPEQRGAPQATPEEGMVFLLFMTESDAFNHSVALATNSRWHNFLIEQRSQYYFHLYRENK
jgi:hypothetical protein